MSSFVSSLSLESTLSQKTVLSSAALVLQDIFQGLQVNLTHLWQVTTIFNV